MKKIIHLLVFFFLVNTALAQSYKAGMFIGGGFARMTVDKNELSDEVSIYKGTPFPTATFGVMAYLSKSRDQPSMWMTIEKSILFEASLCRCGGSVQLSTTLPTGDKTYDELNYVQYQGNFSPKILLGLNKLHFLVGPNLSANFYSGVEVVKDQLTRSAKGQFNPMAIGYELGLGSSFGSFLLSGRYRNYFTAYGKESALIPTELGNSQFYFALSYFFWNRNIEKNSRSIFWGK